MKWAQRNESRLAILCIQRIRINLCDYYGNRRSHCSGHKRSTACKSLNRGNWSRPWMHRKVCYSCLRVRATMKHHACCLPSSGLSLKGLVTSSPSLSMALGRPLSHSCSFVAISLFCTRTLDDLCHLQF